MTDLMQLGGKKGRLDPNIDTPSIHVSGHEIEGSGRELICLVRIRFYVFYVFRVECIRVAGAAQFLRGMIPKHEG